MRRGLLIIEKLGKLFVISIFLISTLFLIRIFQGKRNHEHLALPIPVMEENAILNRYGIEATKIRLFSYPTPDNISWDRNEKYDGDFSLKISIKNNNSLKTYYCSGIDFILPFNLSMYKYSGIIEFWIKGGKNYFCAKCLDLVFKDKKDTQVKLNILKFFYFDEKWQHVSIPLSEFLKEESLFWDGKAWSPRPFNWNEIKSLIFAMPLDNCDNIEIFIDSLIIVDNNKRILDIFSYFE